MSKTNFILQHIYAWPRFAEVIVIENSSQKVMKKTWEKNMVFLLNTFEAM